MFPSDDSFEQFNDIWGHFRPDVTTGKSNGVLIKHCVLSFTGDGRRYFSSRVFRDMIPIKSEEDPKGVRIDYASVYDYVCDAKPRILTIMEHNSKLGRIFQIYAIMLRKELTSGKSVTCMLMYLMEDVPKLLMAFPENFTAAMFVGRLRKRNNYEKFRRKFKVSGKLYLASLVASEMFTVKLTPPIKCRRQWDSRNNAIAWLVVRRMLDEPPGPSPLEVIVAVQRQADRYIQGEIINDIKNGFGRSPNFAITIIQPLTPPKIPTQVLPILSIANIGGVQQAIRGIQEIATSENETPMVMLLSSIGKTIPNMTGIYYTDNGTTRWLAGISSVCCYDRPLPSFALDRRFTEKTEARVINLSDINQQLSETKHPGIIVVGNVGYLLIEKLLCERQQGTISSGISPYVSEILFVDVDANVEVKWVANFISIVRRCGFGNEEDRSGLQDSILEFRGNIVELNRVSEILAYSQDLYGGSMSYFHYLGVCLYDIAELMALVFDSECGSYECDGTVITNLHYPW